MTEAEMQVDKRLTAGALSLAALAQGLTVVSVPAKRNQQHWPGYSSCRRHQMRVSLRPLGARSSHWYMPHRPSSPRAYVEYVG
jgi:hypothetical protein